MPKRKIPPPGQNDKKKKAATTNASPPEISNTSEMGTLYLNILSDNLHVVQPSTDLYMGNAKYTVTAEFNPIVIFNDYIRNVFNNMYGYIKEAEVTLFNVKNNPTKMLVHFFLSILYYNNVTFPSNVKVFHHDRGMLLGECLYFDDVYEKNLLNIHVCSDLIKHYLNSEINYDIKFSNKINHEQYSFHDNLKDFNESAILSQDLYSAFITLFVLADHAATHYIEKYTGNNTDWVHHFLFGENIPSFTLIKTIFHISANISDIEPSTKIICTTMKNQSDILPSIINLFSQNKMDGGVSTVNSVNTENLVSDIFNF